MSQQESIGPRQSTRTVTATRKRTIAEERARILGRKRTPPSALEVAAVQLGREQEAKASRAQEKHREVSRQQEAPSFSVQQVSLRANSVEPDEDVGWKAYPQRQESKRRGRRLGGIAVGSFATRLIQRERSGGRRLVTDPRARALEVAARRWAEQRTNGDHRPLAALR